MTGMVKGSWPEGEGGKCEGERYALEWRLAQQLELQSLHFENLSIANCSSILIWCMVQHSRPGTYLKYEKLDCTP